MTTTLVWLRNDLRIADNPALADSARRGKVLALYVLDEKPGGASAWWLHQSLAALGRDLERLGGRLVLAKGPAEREIPRLARELGAAVAWNRRTEPDQVARESWVRAALEGVEVRRAGPDLLFPPGQIATKDGRPFQVFTAFWRAALAAPPPPAPVPAPERLESPDVSGLHLDELGLMPRIPWYGGMAEAWVPGEAGARQAFADFLDSGIEDYARLRDRPDLDGTSRLSPHLAFGEISPRQIFAAIRGRPPSDGAETFLKEVGWREFAYNLLSFFPDLPHRPLRPEFAAMDWQGGDDQFKAWRKGLTGFPVVDAGMRQLWATGWMHNRVRMITASFLIKDLLIPWQRGREWFADTLVDHDAAVNAASWQWVAGSGADAAPFFRIFNPVTQGEKFDPTGAYIRRWVPELADLPDALVHRPWEAPPMLRPRNYPAPMVDHGAARERALAAFKALKG